MAEQVTPTKSALINTKKSLDLAKVGYELLDRKRNILIRETMSLIDVANRIQQLIDSTYSEAYIALQRANITLGINDSAAMSVPIEDGVSVKFRSVMGIEIPSVEYTESPLGNYYGIIGTHASLDEAYVKFDKVKKLTIKLAEIENSVYRLANAIKKTQKRANSLKNITIPRLERDVKFINESLEEKEREEFSRLKVIKATR